MSRYFILFALIIGIITTSCHEKISEATSTGTSITIAPDYDSITIPVNIAPLNFRIKEDALKYQVVISSKEGEAISIQQTSPVIQIPVKPWHKLLNQNKGNLLSINVSLKKEGKWFSYNTITDSIASDSLNPYLVYRVINTQYSFSYKMKIEQRNLENFDVSLIWDNHSSNHGCVNCHSFSNYNPDKMSMHFRQSFGGTLIKNGDTLKEMNTKTPYTMSPFGYVSWNPNGELIAYSVNKFNEYFTNSTRNLNEVTDQASDLVVYNVKKNDVTTSPKISTKNRENFPTWSPDGKWLYYISAREAFEDFNSRYYSMYSLCRISYDMETNSWGDVDTVFNAYKEGKSLTFPRISPDGKYALFCLINYGYFSINHRESDLYLMNLETREYKKIGINSNVNESYHSWSKNGRWIVFSSKRLNQIYSAPYFSYFDKSGNFHKPFILPQKNPDFYNAFMQNFNIPEFVDRKVDLDPIKIRKLLYNKNEDVTFDNSVNTDALSGATWIAKHKK